MYLKKFAYKNAKGEDLWNEIGKASRLPVRNMVNSWLKQVGFPLVEAQKHDSRLVVTQKRFVHEKKGRETGIWHVPLSLSQDGKTINKLVTKSQDTLAVADSPLVVNPGRHGDRKSVV